VTTVFLTHDPGALSVYYGDAALAALRDVAEVRLNTSGGLLGTQALADAAAGCELIVGDVNTPAEGALFDALPDLVAFHRCAVDRRTVDVAAASRNGVLVTNASPGFVESVTELVFGLMIDLARGVGDAVAEYRAGRTPAQRVGAQLAGATLGVIGYGRIGARVAALGRAFGMTVLAYDPYKAIGEPEIRQTGLDELLAASDFVVCLAVASEETNHLMNAARFAAMKPTAFFVNVSRPVLVDEDALAAALKSGRIAGAALDVGSAPEMMPPVALGRRPDVIATPHIGGLTPQATQAQAMETVEQVRAVLAGRMPQNALNPEHATRLARFRDRAS
jgi:D-3-phosphoglycerate dehydrogenase / 2-oxoglutarate reductase